MEFNKPTITRDMVEKDDFLALPTKPQQRIKSAYDGDNRNN